MRKYCCCPCCCSAVLPLWIGRYVMLHCCYTAVVGWSLGGWWVVGAWWVAARLPPEMAEGRTKKTAPLLTGSSRRKNRPTSPCLPVCCRPCCCTAAMLYWVGWWVMGGVVGALCGCAWRVGGNPITCTCQTHLFAAVRTAGLL